VFSFENQIHAHTRIQKKTRRKLNDTKTRQLSLFCFSLGLYKNGYKKKKNGNKREKNQMMIFIFFLVAVIRV
jgi:hypothetical protein